MFAVIEAPNHAITHVAFVSVPLKLFLESKLIHKVVPNDIEVKPVL